MNNLEFKKRIEAICKSEKILELTIYTAEKILQNLELLERDKFPHISSEQDDKGTIILEWIGRYGQRLYFFINDLKIEYLTVCPQYNLKMDDGEIELSEITRLWNWFIKHEGV